MRRNIKAKVIALTKSISLVQPTQEEGYVCQFMTGGKYPFQFGSLGKTWWYTKSSFKAVENIASMLVESDPVFSDCDLDSVEEVIKLTLQEVCVDKRLFNQDILFFRQRKTLFDCRNDNLQMEEFVKIIVDSILFSLKSRLSSWLTLYVAPRISGNSFFIEQEGLHIINKNDICTWDNIVRKGYHTNSWSPITAEFTSSEKSFFSGLEYDYVFLAEQYGTQKGTISSSALKFRKLFSILFSLISQKTPYRLNKVIAQPYSRCIQFPEKTRNLGYVMTGIGDLVPYYSKDNILRTEDIEKIQNWFKLCSNLERESHDRINVCAHFINLAMNSNNIQSYINYFISLDALFGTRGSVETSILNGVKSLNLQNKWNEKMPWLFELRCDLVHGGSRYVKEWSKYYKYYSHFDSEPDLDIEKIAFLALYQSPNVFNCVSPCS